MPVKQLYIFIGDDDGVFGHKLTYVEERPTYMDRNLFVGVGEGEQCELE